MKERDIRIKTKELLEAYTELTGMPVTPSLETFLMLRKEAEKELLNGFVHGESDTKESCLIQASPQINSIDQSGKVMRSESSNNSVPKVHAERSNNVASDVENYEEGIQMDEIPDLLDSFLDPWN
jgi:hypothetical protein